eukprot:SAG22_NODE_451_length_10354_cov_5.184983_4_plen_628_part_00
MLFEPVVENEVQAQVTIAAVASGVTRHQGRVAQFGAAESECAAVAVPVRPPRADAELENPPGELTGRVAVVGRGAVAFGAKARRVAARGAVAMLIVNHDDEPYVPLGTAVDEDIRIPVVCIGKTAGECLLAAGAGEAAVVSISYRTPSAEGAPAAEAAGKAEAEVEAEAEAGCAQGWEARQTARRLRRLVQADMRRYVNAKQCGSNVVAAASGNDVGVARVLFQEARGRRDPATQSETQTAADTDTVRDTGIDTAAAWLHSSESSCGAGFSRGEATSAAALKAWLGCSDWTKDTAGKLDPIYGGPMAAAGGTATDGLARWSDLWFGVPDTSAAEIQTVYRRRLAGVRVVRLRQLLRQMEKLQQTHIAQAATTIQARFRVLGAKATLRRVREERRIANTLTQEEEELLAEKHALMMCLNAEIERDRLTAQEVDVLAKKTALMLCLNAGIEGEHPLTPSRPPKPQVASTVDMRSSFAGEDSSILNLFGACSATQTAGTPSCFHAFLFSLCALLPVLCAEGSDAACIRSAQVDRAGGRKTRRRPPRRKPRLQPPCPHQLLRLHCRMCCGRFGRFGRSCFIGSVLAWLAGACARVRMFCETSICVFVYESMGGSHVSACSKFEVRRFFLLH